MAIRRLTSEFGTDLIAEGDSTMWDEIIAKRAEVKAKYPKPS